jgi:hypothetical protein
MFTSSVGSGNFELRNRGQTWQNASDSYRSGSLTQYKIERSDFNMVEKSLLKMERKEKGEQKHDKILEQFLRS